MDILIKATLETVYMVGAALGVSILLGLPLGIIVVLTSTPHLHPRPFFSRFLNGIINITRSIPFIILMIVLIPFTRLITGSAIGTTAAVVPLSLAAVPFLARQTEAALREVGVNLIETAQAMGATTFQIVWRVFLGEARSGILAGITITAVNLISYSAMAGVIGGGGLGDLAVRYGYQRFRADIMLQTIIILVVLVQGTQLGGDYLVRRLHRIKSGN